MVIIEASFFNNLAKDVYENENKKWWFNKDGTEIANPDHRLLMLVISEIVEAMEGDRKDLYDDKITTRKMVEVELADAIIRLLDRMEGKNLPKFRGIYKYKDTYAGSTDITQGLFDITGCVVDWQLNRETEIIVHKILDLSIAFGYDVLSAINEKREYNKNREDHSYESRSSENGKKY